MPVSPENLTNPQVRALKAIAQRTPSSIRVGKNGISDAFLTELVAALASNELVKLKFMDHREEKKELAAQIATKTESHCVMMVGNVAVFFRQNPNPTKQKIVLPGPAPV